jgi:hypothetical protein
MRINLKWIGLNGLLLMAATTGSHAAVPASASPSNEGAIMTTKTAKNVFRALGAGRWYPAVSADLKAAVDGYLSQAHASAVTGRIVAAIAPHAGYIYSGPVAGHTFRAIQLNAGSEAAPETVIILGFSHRSAFEGLALLDADAILTPLGETALDRDAMGTLIKASPRIRYATPPHQGEHSAENEVPFVQTALPHARLVIGLFGDHDPASLDAIARALLGLAEKKKILVVASTDLLHDPDYPRVTRTDQQTLRQIAALDERALLARWQPDSQICCGLMPVLTAIRVAKGAGCAKGTPLYYRNSGDDHPESRGSWVVGYGAMVFTVP